MVLEFCFFFYHIVSWVVEICILPSEQIKTWTNQPLISHHALGISVDSNCMAPNYFLICAWKESKLESQMWPSCIVQSLADFARLSVFSLYSFKPCGIVWMPTNKLLNEIGHLRCVASRWNEGISMHISLWWRSSSSGFAELCLRGWNVLYIYTLAPSLLLCECTLRLSPVRSNFTFPAAPLEEHL